MLEMPKQEQGHNVLLKMLIYKQIFLKQIWGKFWLKGFSCGPLAELMWGYLCDMNLTGSRKPILYKNFIHIMLQLMN